MARPMTVADSIEIEVAPDVAYDAVSDVTQMGRWSPENRGARTARDGAPLRVGDTFVGDNKRGSVPIKWQTRCVVTAAERPERFAFTVTHYGFEPLLIRVPVASWEYRFEAIEGGTRVTETWRDDRTAWPDVVAGVFDRLATGGKRFHEFQRGNIARTLKRLKAELEAGA